MIGSVVPECYWPILNRNSHGCQARERRGKQHHCHRHRSDIVAAIPFDPYHLKSEVEVGILVNSILYHHLEVGSTVFQTPIMVVRGGGADLLNKLDQKSKKIYLISGV